MGNYARTPANFDPKWVTGPHTQYGHIPWKVGISGVVDRPPAGGVLGTPRRCALALMHDSRGAMHSMRSIRVA